MSDLENDLGEDIDFEEFEAHTEKLLEEGRTKDDLFEFVGFMNINEVGTHMIAAEMVLDEDAIDQMSENLRKLDIDLSPLGELTGGLKGGEDVKRALGALFLELVELCELDEDDEDAGEPFRRSASSVELHQTVQSANASPDGCADRYRR